MAPLLGSLPGRGDPVGGDRKAQKCLQRVDGGVWWGKVASSGGKGEWRKGRWWPVFLGTHTPRLDDKGRIFLPAKFREELSEGLVVTRGQERCLYVWTAAEFRTFTEQLRKAPVTNKRARDFMRMLFAGASAEIADKQGRVTLPQMLRDYAGLRRDCVVIGAFNRVEIWDATSWSNYSEEQEPAFADWSEEVLPITES